MTDGDAVIAIMIGCATAALTWTSKHFYWGGRRRSPMRKDNEMPLWAGRLLFGGIGAAFILAGVAHFLLRK